MSPDLALACLFASAPIQRCGQPAMEPVLASSWPLAGIFVGIVALAAYAYLRALYPHEIDCEPDADKPLETLETRARKFDGH